MGARVYNTANIPSMSENEPVTYERLVNNLHIRKLRGRNAIVLSSYLIG